MLSDWDGNILGTTCTARCSTSSARPRNARCFDLSRHLSVDMLPIGTRHRFNGVTKLLATEVALSPSDSGQLYSAKRLLPFSGRNFIRRSRSNRHQLALTTNFPCSFPISKGDSQPFINFLGKTFESQNELDMRLLCMLKGIHPAV